MRSSIIIFLLAGYFSQTISAIDMDRYFPSYFSASNQERLQRAIQERINVVYDFFRERRREVPPANQIEESSAFEEMTDTPYFFGRYQEAGPEIDLAAFFADELDGDSGYFSTESEE